MQAFLETFKPGSETRILDAGGTPEFWEGADGPQPTILNTAAPPPGLADSSRYVVGSATEMPFEDDAFDIVFSNSMIEHLGDRDSQEAFAREARRVGRGYWVQTPDRWFPVEPHVLTPLVHYLPRRAQRRLLRNFTVWGLLTRPDQDYVDRFVAETILLSAPQMRALFPGAELRRERFLGLTKSLIAVSHSR